MWLYVPKIPIDPSKPSPSAPASEVLSSDCTKLSEEQAIAFARSVTWRGKPMQPAYWSGVWKKGRWTRHLSGVTSAPSILSLGVASWIASQGAFLVSRGPWRGDSEGRTTSDISGLTLPDSSNASNPGSSVSRTSPTICGLEDTKSSETYNAWATALRRACGQRRKSEPLTDESESSSSESERPKVTAAMVKALRDRTGGGLVDCRAALIKFGDTERAAEEINKPLVNWRTPDTQTCGGPQDLQRRAGHGIRLQDQVHDLWPTALTKDSEEAGFGPSQAARKTQPLNVVASLWPTSTAMDSESSARQGYVGKGNPGTTLTDAARNFPTPSASDYGSSQNGICAGKPSGGPESLSTRARNGSLPGGGKGSLNPIFVEALMGWPLGWTDAEEGAGEFVQFPPGPKDAEGWAEYLQRHPEAVPAVNFEVPRRVDRLRACGNGVVPAQACAAYTELFVALGVNRRGMPTSKTPMTHEVASKDLPTQPGDEKLVRPEDGPDSPQWGELFGRPRVEVAPAPPPASALFYQEDAVSLLSSLPEGCVNLIITDPAYESLEKHRAKGTTTRLKHSDASSNDWFDIFKNDRFPEFFAAAYRALAKDSHLYVLCDQETAFAIKPMGEAAGFKFWKPLIWDKLSIGLGYHYRCRYEMILFFEKGKRRLSDLGVPDVLEFARVFKGYPTEKPVGLLEVLISQSSSPGELVVDPFMGSGSTGVAALKNGRNFIGGDLSEKSMAMAKERCST